MRFTANQTIGASMMKFRPGTIFVGVLFTFLISGCQSASWVNSQTGNEEPPFKWYPFEPYPLTVIDREYNREISGWHRNRLDPERYNNRWPDRFTGDLACLSRVEDPPGIVINLTGTIKGGLSYNQGKRMTNLDGIPGLNGGNTTLGQITATGTAFGISVTRTFYKYEVEITWDSLIEAFYGQMIAEPTTATNPDIEFSDDSPANDWDGLEWSGLQTGEEKADFPTFEVEGNTVRWIDAPQGTGDGGKQFVLIYAGACGVVTHLKIIEITHSTPPTARTITKQQFEDAVDDWSFEPAN